MAREVLPAFRPVGPVETLRLEAILDRRRHERRHVAPQVEAAEVPAGSANPGDGAAHVLHDQRDMTASSLAGFALDAKTGVRSAERRVGKEGVSTCQSRWAT